MTTQQNKAIVARMNKEFIECGDLNTINELLDPSFINHTAPPGSPKGPEGVIYFFNHLLRPAFPDLKVIIHDQVAEGDKVTTRKSFHATHRGEFFGVPPTDKTVVMDVIDIITLCNGKFIEHWGILDMNNVMAQITAK